MNRISHLDFSATHAGSASARTGDAYYVVYSYFTGETEGRTRA